MRPTAAAHDRRAIRRRSQELRQRSIHARNVSERLRRRSSFFAEQSLRAMTTLDDLGLRSPGRPRRLAALAIRVGRDPAIQLAKTALAQTEGITPREAFADMRAVSQQRNIKLRDVARTVVLAGKPGEYRTLIESLRAAKRTTCRRSIGIISPGSRQGARAGPKRHTSTRPAHRSAEPLLSEPDGEPSESNVVRIIAVPPLGPRNGWRTRAV